jgi:hypothetical protein
MSLVPRTQNRGKYGKTEEKWRERNTEREKERERERGSTRFAFVFPVKV